jgi:hypothetical protein
MIFNALDEVCAENLMTDVETFVKKIEATTEYRAEVIIYHALCDDNKEKLQQARRCFNLIK